jgi:signal transduction histidine kinase
MTPPTEARPDSQPAWRGVAWGEVAVAGAAVVAAAAAFWVTATADFLAYPWWLAVQKADFILGPVFVGLYWLRRRPESRFGLVLIGFGFVGAVYVLQSASDPWLFGAGLLWENVVGLAAYVLILTFPTGRLDGLAAKLIVLAALLLAVVPAIVILLLLPQVGAGGSISGCRELCPENALAITSNPSLALDLWEIFRYAVIGIAIATAALLVWRLVTGTPPQRRALMIGAPLALLFLSLQVVFHLLALVAPDATTLREVVAWAFAAARAGLWYGFLAALIASELFAARAMQRLVGESLRRPSLRELEAMLRGPLGDPRLRLTFWDTKSDAWNDALRPEPESGLDLTLVEHDGRPAAAILHDSQLNDDPELLRAAGGVALLAAENAELDRSWHNALQELRQSRSRIVRSADHERRKLERDLHDGVQQRLVAIAIELGLARDLVADPAIHARLDEIGESVAEALDELREISHGLYPSVLSDYGLGPAITRIRRHTRAELIIQATGLTRHSPELESAVYYCCLEAIQNATKHAGRAPRVTVVLHEDADVLTFEITDDGRGFDPAAQSTDGAGLENMRDRIGALDGRLSIVSAPGKGTTVSASVPLRAHESAAELRSSRESELASG